MDIETEKLLNWTRLMTRERTKGPRSSTKTMREHYYFKDSGLGGISEPMHGHKTLNILNIKQV